MPAGLSPTKQAGVWANPERSETLAHHPESGHGAQAAWRDGDLISSGSKRLVSGGPGITALCYKKEKDSALPGNGTWKELVSNSTPLQ